MKIFYLKEKEKRWYVLIVISCVHLFFVNIKDSHDWGDDFAQYIHQAKNVVNGTSQLETGYIFNSNFPMFAPPAYAMGFPLLVAPVYAIWGNNMQAFSYFISVWLSLSAIVLFLFFKKHFSSFTSYLLILIMVLNPLILNFKMEILSEIPFLFLLYSLILLYGSEKKNLLFYILLGLLSGYLLLIRNLGAVFIIAVVIDESIKYFKDPKEQNKKRVFIYLPVFVAMSVFCYVLINYFLFHIPLHYFSGALNLFKYEDTWNTFLKNIDYYFNVYQGLFETNPDNNYKLFSTILKSFFFSFALLGSIIRFKREISFIDILFSIYTIVLLIYPTANSGFRYVLPVIPIFLLYATEAARFLCNALSVKKFIIYGICILSFYLVYKSEWQLILDKQNIVLEGPQRLYSRDMFNHIKTNTEKNARILFVKPRALALYSDRSCFINNPDELYENLESQLKNYQIDYILVSEEISDKTIKNFVADNPGKIKLTWNNSVYKLYKIGGK